MRRHRKRGEILRFLREVVWQNQYHYTRHAKVEMRNDHLHPRDIHQVLLTGNLVRTQTRDSRGPRYVMRGTTTQGRVVEVVWRRVLDYVRILTVYGVKSV